MFKKIVSLVLFMFAFAGVSFAADPASLDGFGTVAKGYISTGQEVAILAAGLSLGWVAVTIVRKYTRKA